jgi:Transposase IS200 like
MDDTWKWFHITIHAYGAWLYGDQRGFRTRHHREHIEGDYKNPPPDGKYDKELERSKKLMKQEAVSLTSDWRKVVGTALRENLTTLGAQVLCVSMSSTHAHILAKMPPGPTPRHWIGRAKAKTSLIAKDHGWVGKLWAVRCKVTPIKNRQHQMNTFTYILAHVDEGAWVWNFRKDATPGTSVPGLSEGVTESPGTEVSGPAPTGD